MSKDAKKRFGAIKIIAIIAGVIVLGLIALPFLIDVNQFKPELESMLSSALGRDVKTGKLSLSILSGAVGVDDLSIADDPAFSSSPFLQAKSLKVGIELEPLIFSRQLRITEIALDAPSINLIRSSSGRWNFSSLGSGKKTESGGAKFREASMAGGSASGNDVLIKQLSISGGRVTINQGGKGKPSTYGDVNITANELSLATAFPFTMSAALPGGGSLSLEGKAGPINRADTAATPVEANIGVKKLNLVDSGFVSPDAGLSGILDFNGALTSDGKKVDSRGNASANKLQVVKGGSPANDAISMDYAVDYNLAQQRGTLDTAKISFGKAVANLSGTFQKTGESLALKMILRGTDMPVDDVKSLLPAFGVILPDGATLQGGVLNTDMTAEGPVDALTITGSSDVSNSRLVGFDLAGKMAALAKLTGLKSDPDTLIETLASKVRVTAGGIRVNDIKLVVPAIGDLYGDGTIAADRSLDFKMRAVVKASRGVGLALTQLVGGGGSGQLTIPFFIRGTSSNPKFVPDLKNAASSILGSKLSGQGSQEGEKSNTGKALENALQNLLGN